MADSSNRFTEYHARLQTAGRRRSGINSQPGADSVDSKVATVQGGWYDLYMARETISDSDILPAPLKTHVESWKKEFLKLPYPPRYLKPQQVKDDHDVWEVLSGRYKQLQNFCPILEVAYIEYKRYNLDERKVNAVCNNIRAATQVKAWKDYWERTTRVRSRADMELKQIIESVGIDVDKLFEPLVTIKKKEFDSWASAHPQAAMAIAIKKAQAEKQKVVEEVFSVGNGQVTYINPETGALRTEKLPRLSHRQRKDNIRAYQLNYEFQRQNYIDEHPEDPDALFFKFPSSIDRTTGTIVIP